ncbi:hypothetical protein [Cetobacterium somerae]|uniref:hypothetical protein n=1 Tax=Cetobacterium somerae TaxID=188913 RepID=UPI0038913DF9
MKIIVHPRTHKVNTVVNFEKGLKKAANKNIKDKIKLLKIGSVLSISLGKLLISLT